MTHAILDSSLLSCWNTFVLHLERELGKETVERWVRSLTVKSTGKQKIILEAKDSFQALWFEEHLRPRLAWLLDPLGMPIAICLQTAGKSAPPKKPSKPSKAEPLAFSLAFHELNPFSTFENFIPLDENTIVLKLLDELCAYLASDRLSKLSPIVAPDTTRMAPPNPVYLCGPSGSGKTHLLTATAHRLKHAGLSVIMARSELFTEHVVKSIRAGEMAAFRNLWRHTDVLIVDDIHLLARKNATQEEFFHTFNSLHVAGKQIILSANCFPQQLQFIEPRLISRFEWGVVLPVSPLPKKLFPTLLEKKANFFNFPLSPKLANALADLFPSTPKACTKALDSLTYRLSLSKSRQALPSGPTALAHIKDLLADLIDEEQLLALTPEKIVNITAETYGIKREDLLGRSQAREFLLPRQVAMYLIRKHLKLPFMRIGELFHKNHSTIMSAIRQVEKLIPDKASDVGSTIGSMEIRIADLSR